MIMRCQVQDIIFGMLIPTILSSQYSSASEFVKVIFYMPSSNQNVFQKVVIKCSHEEMRKVHCACKTVLLQEAREAIIQVYLKIQHPDTSI